MSRGLLLMLVGVTILVVACGAAGGAGGPGSSPAMSPVPTSSSAASPAASAGSSTELVADIDVGGRTLHLYCAGPTDTGEPTVILEGGLMTPSDAWTGVLGGMRETHRVCAYDRAGLGLSQPATETSRTTADLVDDLRAMLDGARVEAPVVLVAHSIGAWPAAVFAERYPDEVAGLVFADPRGPRVSADWRAALPAESAGEPMSVTLNRQELGAFETDPSMNQERLDLAASAAEAAAALDASGPLFGDLPVIVLRGGLTTQSWSDLPPDLAATFDEIWLSGQQELVDESTAGKLVVVPDAGHEFAYEQPEPVIAAVESLLAGLPAR